MAEIIEFPFDSGAYEAADREWLPPNLLERVENMRLDLDGRLGIRPGTTALGTTTYSSAQLTAYDLTNFSGRLVALGDQCGLGRPTDLFELVSAARVWRGLAGEDGTSGTGPRLPRATNVRDIGRMAELAGPVATCHVATNGTVLCSAAQTTVSRAMIHVFKPDTDQTLLSQSVPLKLARVVFAGSLFWVIGQSPSNDDIVGYNFNPVTGAQISAVVTLRALAGAVADLAAAQTGASDFTIAYTFGTTVLAERFNSAGVTQANWTAFATQSKAVGVCGNAAGTLISVGRNILSSGLYEFSTFNAAGALQTGPTQLFNGSSAGGQLTSVDRYSFGMTQTGAQIAFVGVADQDSTFGNIAPEAECVFQVCTNQATHALTFYLNYRNSFPETLAVPITGGNFSGLDFYCGAVDYVAAGNNRGTNQLVGFERREPQVFKDIEKGAPLTNLGVTNRINGSCAIGTKIYWCNLQRASDTGNASEDMVTFSVTETEMKDTGRRSVAQLAGELYIAGGMPVIYDGQYMVEQGFAEAPQIMSLNEAASGGKTLLGVYRVRVIWAATDARGNTVRSQVSGTTQDALGTGPETITLTGANQTLTVVATAPHSLRTHPLLQNQGGYSVRVEVYCTTAGGGNFFLDKTIRIDPNLQDYAAPMTISLTQTDAQLQDNAVLYTQSQTPVPHVSPQPYRYAWAARERQIVGGLPSEEEWTFSKLLFPAEPIEFAGSGRLGFSGRANQQITAVGAFETVGLIWTKSEVAIIPGRGPEHNGTGEFDASIRVPSPGGASDWRSVVDAPPGFFFQMAADKLMLVPRTANAQGSAGAVTWIGQPVRQTLAAFPVITGAVHVRSQMLVAFSCTNTVGDAGRIIIYDLRREQWYVDTIGPAVAVSELDGRLAYIIAGVVFLQDLTAGIGAMPTALVQTGMQPVTKRLGWGHIYKIGLLGLDTGACSVECFIDYDDGLGFRSLGTEVFTGTGVAVQRFWSLSIQKTPRFALRFVMTGGSGTLGLRFNAWALEVEGSKNMVRVGSGGNVA